MVILITRLRMAVGYIMSLWQEQKFSKNSPPQTSFLCKMIFVSYFKLDFVTVCHQYVCFDWPKGSEMSE